MKRHFLTGLILLLPFAISALLVIWLIDLLTDPFLDATKKMFSHFVHEDHPSAIEIFLGRLFVLIFLFFFTAGLGFLGRKYLFSKLFKNLQTLFLKMPIIRVVYKLCHDIAEATFTPDTKLFKETVLVPFPYKDSFAIGLVTGKIPPSLQKEFGGEVEAAVFVPTSPHPISGFLLLTPHKLTKPIDLSTEDAFKYIISCGTVPDTTKPNP